MASLQELGPDHVVFQQRRADIGEGADLRWALAQLGGRLVRSRVDNVLAGDRSTVEQVEIVFGSDDQLHDLTSYTRHVGRDTTGQLLSKGVLLDRARTLHEGPDPDREDGDRHRQLPGRVRHEPVAGRPGRRDPVARDRPAGLPPRGALLVRRADRRDASCSTSRAAGIPPDDARKFIVLGFLEPVVARVPLEEAQDRLREALEAKWAAGRAGRAPRAA